MGEVVAERAAAVPRVPCCWGCGEWLEPDAWCVSTWLRVCVCNLGLIAERPVLAPHESTECPRRLVECRNGCGIQGLQAHEQEQHEVGRCVSLLDSPQPQQQVEQCPVRVVDCPLNCGESMRRDVVEAHLERDCINRTVECDLECGECMKAKHLAVHKKRDCRHRLVVRVPGVSES